MQKQSQNERCILDLAVVGLAEVPIFGRYEYCSARPGLAAHRHPKAVEICYLERGFQTYRVDQREYNLVGGDLFVTAPGELHDTGGHPEDRGILYWLNLRIPQAGEPWLTLPPAESALLITMLSSFPERRFAGRPVLKQIFNKVFELCDEPTKPLVRIAVANQLVRCILEIIDCAYRPEGSQRSPLISRIVERIKSHPEREYSLTSLADEAGLSLSRFKSKFKAQMGIAPHEFILHCKVDAAKQLLVDQRRTVTDTAMSLGFSSSQYFATVFKRFTQQTPVEFCTKGPAVPLRSDTVLLRKSL
jgi:AraC-like DNA-binding protein